MKTIVGLGMLCFAFIHAAVGQVDTSFVYRTGMPYGTLDIRVSKSASRYYYLQENKTFSFRESSPGVKTDSYRDMTSWDSSPYTQGNLREKNGSSDYFIMNYRLLFPDNYNPSYDPGYPIIVMIHGAGERGNCWAAGCYWADKTWKPLTNTPAAPTTSTHELLNNDHNLLHGGKVHLDARNLAAGKLPNDPTLNIRAFPGFVLFPQNLNGWDANTAQDAIRLVRLVAKKYNVDENRIYIHGLSNGGYGVYEILKRASWLFAASLPMSAISDAGITGYPSVLADVSHIPLWIFQGGIDTNPTPAKTRNYVKKFRDAGMVIRYNEYSNLGHGVWNTAYNELDFFSWILSKNKANVHSFSGASAICLTNGQGVKLELAKGFLAYQWEKDGVVIPDAHAAIYVANSPGVYRARFSRVVNPSEQQWNRWSDPITVTESNPSQAQMIQKGTVLLKGLNNYGNAHLSAVGDFAHYYWYKDGVLLDVPGTQDDTTKNPIFKQGTCTNLPACTGNGVYTLVTAGFDNCPSPPSEPKYIYFNNQAPINLIAPGAFTGSSPSASSISLNWTDTNTNENGYEVWRRKVISAGTYTTWALTRLTQPNATSHTDTNLEPSTVYQYKVRAVGNTGRSNYTPAASNQYLSVSTQVDTQGPSIPENLVATSTGIREVSLNWTASTDDTGIRKYLVLFEDDTIEVIGGTSVKIQNLELNHQFSFTVKASDLGGNLSDESNVATASTYMTGLYYEHSTGGWSDLDQIDWNIAEYKGMVSTFTLTPRTQEDYFNFEFDGYIYITIPGEYQFRTTSDDGSRLTLNSVVIVENDGLHGNLTITSGNQLLQNGPHLVNVKYFEYGGGQTLTVQYKGPDTNNNWLTIPASALKSGDQEIISAARIAAKPDADVDNIEPKSKFTFYPNPLSPDGAINIIAENIRNESVKIKLVNLMGERFFDDTYESSEINDGITIGPRSTLRKGIYILLIQQGAEVTQHRLIVNDRN